MKRILIAGIGNIFLGDDAFGGETVRELSHETLPAEVTAKDFGIRSYDLAYALIDNYDTIILVDAAPRGEAPGTVSLLELDLAQLEPARAETVDAHSMDPVRVLQMAQTLAPVTARVLLVGCEPASIGGNEGQLGLSQPVREAIPNALAMIKSQIRAELDFEQKMEAGAQPA
jgi:hydrogenase maturation protease